MSDTKALLKAMNDIQPSYAERGIYTLGVGIQLDSGQLLPEVGGIVKLPNAATLWLNAGGDLRVVLLNNHLSLKGSVLYKNVQGDFHRIVKAIVATDTTVLDIVIDYRTPFKI